MRQRQGRHDAGPMDAAARARDIRGTTTITTAPCNPYKDIQPPGTYTIIAAGGTRRAPTDADVYDPTGRWLGTIPHARLLTLWETYQHSAQQRPQGFEEAVAALMARYQRDPDQQDRKAQPPEQAALPGSIVETILACLRVTPRATVSEMFASPLNCSRSADEYYSRDQADACFGARHDAYRTAWTGLQFAHPPHTPDASRKALLWALACAEATNADETPTLTVLALPKATTYPHTQWLQHPLCRELASWSAGHAGLTVGLGADTPAKRQRGITLVAVGNTTGLELLRPKLKQLAIKLNRSEHRPARVVDYRTWAVDRAATLAATGPNTCPALPTALLKQATYLHKNPKATAATSPSAPRLPLSRFQAEHAPAHDLRSTVWTDGSVQKLTTQEGNEVQVAGACAWLDDNRVVYVNPNGSGCTNTITRAELAAIRAALAEFGSVGKEFGNKKLTIASDSAASLYLIKRAINEPRRLHLSKHRDLLGSIVELLHARQTRGAHADLIKVVSHTGLHGNEMADEGAGAVAVGEKQADVSETADNNPTPRPTFTVTRDDGSTDTHYVSDLNRGLTKALSSTCQGGYCKDTLYTQKWAEAASTLDCRASTAYMTHADAGHRLRRFVQTAGSSRPPGRAASSACLCSSCGTVTNAACAPTSSAPVAQTRSAGMRDTWHDIARTRKWSAPASPNTTPPCA